ncbi:MAG: MotE family protein [Nitrospirota bacterium]
MTEPSATVETARADALARPWIAAICVLGLLCAGAGAPGAPPADGPSAPEATADQEPSTPEALLKAMKQREDELNQRADVLHQQEQRLKIMDQDLRAMMDKYVKLRDEALQKAKQAAGSDQASDDSKYAQLAKVYEQMAADEAAARIEKMDEAVALKILAVAKPKAAAKILMGLPAAKAARLSERLATGRK